MVRSRCTTTSFDSVQPQPPYFAPSVGLQHCFTGPMELFCEFYKRVGVSIEWWTNDSLAIHKRMTVVATYCSGRPHDSCLSRSDLYVRDLAEVTGAGDRDANGSKLWPLLNYKILNIFRIYKSSRILPICRPIHCHLCEGRCPNLQTCDFCSRSQ